MSFLQVSTANPLGKRPLQFMAEHQGPPVYAGLLGWIAAAATPGDYDNNAQVLAALVSMGAITQAESNAIDAGMLSLDDLPVNMTMINEALSEAGQPGAPTVLPLPTSTSTPLEPLQKPNLPGGVAPFMPPATSASPAQIPTGSTIAYTLSWSPGLGNLTLSTANVISAFARALPNYRMSVLNSQVTQSYASLGSPGYTVQFNIVDSVGHQNISDAQSVLDSVARTILGSGNVTASAITGIYAPGTGGGLVPSPGGTGIVAWAEQNAIWIGVLILAAVTLPTLARRL